MLARCRAHLTLIDHRLLTVDDSTNRMCGLDDLSSAVIAGRSDVKTHFTCGTLTRSSRLYSPSHHNWTDPVALAVADALGD